MDANRMLILAQKPLEAGLPELKVKSRQIRLRNLCLGHVGCRWYDDDDDDAESPEEEEEEKQLRLVLRLAEGGCIVIEDASIAIAELQVICKTLEECDAANDQEAEVTLSLHYGKKQILAKYILHREVTIAHLIRLLTQKKAKRKERADDLFQVEAAQKAIQSALLCGGSGTAAVRTQRQHKNGPSLGTKKLSINERRRIENGFVSNADIKRAHKLLAAFFSAAVDDYECTWPHTPGAQYCQDLFSDRIDKHRIRKGSGGTRIAATSFADSAPPAGIIETLYANSWGTTAGKHYHRKGRGKQATVQVIPVYEDETPIRHAGHLATWFSPHVDLYKGGRPGEYVLRGGADAVAISCYAGATLCVNPMPGTLPGYEQISHRQHVTLLPRSTSSDDHNIGAMHTLQKVTYRKFPVRVRLKCVHEAGADLASAITAIATDIIPNDASPALAERIDIELRNSLARQQSSKWWTDPRGVLELEIPGRLATGMIVLWAQLKHGLRLDPASNNCEEIHVQKASLVRATYRIIPGAERLEATIPMRIKRPLVTTSLELRFDSGQPLDTASVLLDDRGRHLVTDDSDDSSVILSPRQASKQDSEANQTVAWTAARWRLETRLAARRRAQTLNHGRRHDTWLIDAIGSSLKEPAELSSSASGLIALFRDPEARFLVPRDLLLGYTLVEDDSIKNPFEQQEVSSLAPDSDTVAVPLIEPKLRWPSKGWATDTKVALTFRKLPARLFIDVQDLLGADLSYALVKAALRGVTIDDDAYQESGSEIEIPGRNPLAIWKMRPTLMHGFKLINTEVQTIDDQTKFELFEDAMQTKSGRSEWSPPASSEILVTIQAGQLSRVRLYIAPPLLTLSIVPIDSSDIEIKGGPQGWIRSLLDVYVPQDADPRYAIEAQAFQEELEESDLQAKAATGRIYNYRLHRQCKIRLLPASLPEGFCLFDNELPFEQDATTIYFRLHKLTAPLKLNLFSLPDNEPIPSRLVGDIRILFAEKDNEDGPVPLADPCQIGETWRENTDHMIDLSVRGFRARRRVAVHVDLRDGTALGDAGEVDICCGAQNAVSLDAVLPLDEVAPRVVVSPWRIDEDINAGRPLDDDAPKGWLFKDCTFEPGPPLDMIPLAGGGAEFRLTEDLHVILSEEARRFLRSSVAPGYDVIETNTFHSGRIFLKCKKPAICRMDVGEELQTGAENTAVEPEVQSPSVQSLADYNAFIPIKVAKQPAEVNIIFVWASSSAAALSCGLRTIKVNEIEFQTGLESRLSTEIEVPGRGTRRAAPVSEASFYIEKTRSWHIMKIEKAHHQHDASEISPVQMDETKFLIAAGSITSIIISLDDFAFWKRLTASWLSRRLAHLFRKRLAYLEVYLTWERTSLRAPIDAIKIFQLGQYRPGRASRDLLAAAIESQSQKVREECSGELKDAVTEVTSPQRRLMKRLSLRVLKKSRPILSLALCSWGPHGFDVRSLESVFVNSRSWITKVSVSVQNDVLGATSSATEVPLIPGKKTTIQIDVSDNPLWYRLSTRRIARAWRHEIRSAMCTATAAVLLGDSERSCGVIDVEAGESLLESLSFYPRLDYAHVFAEERYPVRFQVPSTGTTLTTRLVNRPGYEIAGIEVTSREELFSFDCASDDGLSVINFPASPKAPKRIENTNNCASLRVELVANRRQSIKILLRRKPARVQFEVYFASDPSRRAPLEILRGVGIGPVKTRAHEASMAIAKPAIDWLKKDHESHCIETILNHDAIGTAPEGIVQIAAAASRSWEIVALTAPEVVRSKKTQSTNPYKRCNADLFAAPCRDKCRTVKVVAGETVLAKVYVSDARLNMGLCVRKLVRHILPSTSVRPIKWRWPRVDGSAEFHKLYGGQLAGDEDDPRMWTKPSRGWTTKLDPTEGKTYYTYTDFTSVQCAGNTSAAFKSSQERRRTEWRAALEDRRRKREIQLRRRRELEVAGGDNQVGYTLQDAQRFKLDTTDLLKNLLLGNGQPI